MLPVSNRVDVGVGHQTLQVGLDFFEEKMRKFQTCLTDRNIDENSYNTYGTRRV